MKDPLYQYPIFTGIITIFMIASFIWTLTLPIKWIWILPVIGIGFGAWGTIYMLIDIPRFRKYLKNTYGD